MEHLKINESEFSLLSGEEFSHPSHKIVKLLELFNHELPEEQPDFAGRFIELSRNQSGESEDNLEDWYEKCKSDSFEKEVERMSDALKRFKEEIERITQSDIESFCRTHLVTSSWIGKHAKDAIIKKIADFHKTSYEIGRNNSLIDGYIGNEPVIIKPYSLKDNSSEDETTNAVNIFYKRNEDGLDLYYQFD